MVQTPKTLRAQPAAVPRQSRSSRARHPLLRRFSAAHGLMVVAGLLAFLLVVALTVDRGRVVEVAVAREDIATGTPLRPDLFERGDLGADAPFADRLVTFDELRGASWRAAGPIAAGDPLRRSDVGRSDARDGLRAMSIPVTREHAAGGALAAGDRVDVIDAVERTPAYVVTDVEVARVASTSSSRGITAPSTREFYVVVLVDADEALAIAAALADGKVEVVRSTGAAPTRPTNAMRTQR